jgi:hypothetical protein
MSKRLIGISAAAALTLAALSPSFAAFNKNRAFLTSNPNAAAGAALWTSAEYFDFSTTSPFPGRTWATLPKDDQSGFMGGEKFAYFQIPPVNGAGSHCYEISTAKGMLGAEGGQDAETINADTKLFILNSSATHLYRMINDDFGNTRYSKVRVWSTGANNLSFILASYSTAYNNIDFYLIIKSLKHATFDACRGAGIDWVNAGTWPFQYP